MPYLPIKKRFHTHFEQMSEHNGKHFFIIGFIDEPDENHDAESLPMFRIRFEDGEEIEAWPYEVFDNA